MTTASLRTANLSDFSQQQGRRQDQSPNRRHPSKSSRIGPNSEERLCMAIFRDWKRPLSLVGLMPCLRWLHSVPSPGVFLAKAIQNFSATIAVHPCLRHHELYENRSTSPYYQIRLFITVGTGGATYVILEPSPLLHRT